VDRLNPYAPPSSTVTTKQSGLAGSTRILLACLVAAQLVVTLFSLPDALHRFRYGDISPLAFFGALFAMGMLTLGGALVVARRRPTASLLIAAAVGALAALQWHAPFVLSGTAISAIAVVVVLAMGRSNR